MRVDSDDPGFLAAEEAERLYEAAMAEEREQLRKLRIRAANLIRSAETKHKCPLNDLQVCRRVRGITLQEVAAVRKELEANGYLADELEPLDPR